MDVSRHESLMLLRFIRSDNNKTIFATVIIAAFLVIVWRYLDWPIGSGFTPDSAGYIGMSPYRQPLYGLWANSAYSLLGTWNYVIRAQVILFIAATALLMWELCRQSIWGILATFLLFGFIALMTRFGMMSLVGSLITEGLFYTLIILFAYCLMLWIRSEYALIPAGMICLILVLMTQLRPAAILVLALPFAAAIYSFLRPSNGVRGRITTIIIPLSLFVFLVAIVPLLVGKRFLQVGTSADSMGFVLLPRISLLEPPEDIKMALPLWNELSASWRKVSEQLSIDALTQFDAQLQEAIRYELGPKVLIPALRSDNSVGVHFDWSSAIDNTFAKAIALRWIKNDFMQFLQVSAAHYWGTLTGSNYMGSNNRRETWSAINKVDDRTWKLAKLRTDYPNNKIFEPLKTGTEIIYFGIRIFSTGILFLGVISAVWLVLRSAEIKIVHPAAIACAAGAGWCLLHSMPAGLLVFPEFRYVYGNLLMYGAAAAVAMAYIGYPRIPHA